jgi:hypothetical protein
MDLNIWKNNFEQSMVNLWHSATEYIPNLVEAFLILFVGFFISKIIKTVSVTVLSKLKLDVASDKIGVHEAFGKIGIKYRFSQVVGFFVFWMLMLTFLVSAADSLNLSNVTQTIDKFIMYLPNVLGAGFIFLLGLWLAQFISDAVKAMAEKVGLEYSNMLATISKSIVLVLVATFAISQLQFETYLIDSVLQILFLSSGAVLALSFGLGTRGLSKNLISEFYAIGQYQIGSNVTVIGKTGVLTEVGSLNSILRAKNGSRVHIPNSTLVNLEVVESAVVPPISS